MEHRCSCWKCRPGIYPDIPDEYDHLGLPSPYMAARFPYHRPLPKWTASQRFGTSKVHITINGLSIYDMGWGVFECLFGEPGWVVYEASNVPHTVSHYGHYEGGIPVWTQCGCGSGMLCSQVAFGLVEWEPLTAAKWEQAPLRRMIPAGVDDQGNYLWTARTFGHDQDEAARWTPPPAFPQVSTRW